MTQIPRVTPLLLAGVLALSACSQDAPAPADPATASTDAGAAPATVEHAIDAPIPAADIDTTLGLVAPPVHVAATDTLRFTVRVHNRGKVTLASAGSAPVNLGAMLIGPDGPDTPPGNRDFQRVTLPAIPQGGSADVVAELPVAPLLGLPVRLELVQEGVAWFSSYGDVPLELGTFARCTDDAATLCSADGQPLASD